MKSKKRKLIVCLDEAGRGPLAGPVVAAAVAVNQKSKIQNLKQVQDSKKLSPRKREEFFRIIKRSPYIKWGVGRVSEKVIDKINILEATKLAMSRAVKNLQKRLSNKIDGREKCGTVDFLIIDGNFIIPKLKISQKAVVRADEKIFECKLASIIAKVVRDRIMVKYDKKYPKYGFAKHKGYPTKEHIKPLKEYGPSDIHRKTFAPVRQVVVK